MSRKVYLMLTLSSSVYLMLVVRGLAIYSLNLSICIIQKSWSGVPL